MKGLFLGFALLAFALMAMPGMAVAADYGGLFNTPDNDGSFAFTSPEKSSVYTIRSVDLIGGDLTITFVAPQECWRCPDAAQFAEHLVAFITPTRSLFEVGWRNANT